jgi:hypothetical protein
VKIVAPGGLLAHEGKNYYVGEAFADKSVGLHLNTEGQTELHFANLYLGNLTFDAAGGRFKPTAYVTPPKAKLQGPKKEGRGGAAPPLP